MLAYSTMESKKRPREDKSSREEKYKRVPAKRKVCKCSMCPQTFMNEGNKKSHEKSHNYGNTIVQPARQVAEEKVVKKRRTKRIVGPQVHNIVKERNAMFRDHLVTTSLPPQQTMDDPPMQMEDPLDGGNLWMDENDAGYAGEDDPVLPEFDDLNFRDGEEVVGGRVRLDEDDDILLNKAQIFENTSDYIQWRRVYYEPFLDGGKYVLPPEFDVEFTKTLAKLNEIKKATFEDVDLGEINRQLLQLTEVGGLSLHVQEHMHNFLLQHLSEEKCSEMLPPGARNLLATKSEDKGLKFTVYNPYLSSDYIDCQMEMANIMDAVIMILKDPDLRGNIVSDILILHLLYPFFCTFLSLFHLSCTSMCIIIVT